MGSTKVYAPPPLDPAQVGRDSLQAQIDLAPQQYASEAQFRPQYAALDMDVLRQTLFGSPDYAAYAKDEQVAAGMQNAFADQEVRAQYQAAAEQAGTSIEAAYAKDYYNNIGKAGGATLPTSGGLADILGQLSPQLSELQAQANTAQRTADIQDVATLGPQMNQALRDANPEMTATLDHYRNLVAGYTSPSSKSELEGALFGKALSDFQLGGQLNDAQNRQVQQSARSAWASRGLGRSQGGAIDETLKALDYGRGLEAERTQRAQQAVAMDMQRQGLNTGMLQGLVGTQRSVAQDPMLAITGRPSMGIQAAQGIAGQGMATPGMPQLFNPFSSDIMGIYAGNQANATNAAIGQANSNASMWGGGMNMFGNIFGGIFGG
jgi:hypothetical protein